MYVGLHSLFNCNFERLMYLSFVKASSIVST